MGLRLVWGYDWQLISISAGLRPVWDSARCGTQAGVGLRQVWDSGRCGTQPGVELSQVWDSGRSVGRWDGEAPLLVSTSVLAVTQRTFEDRAQNS